MGGRVPYNGLLVALQPREFPYNPWGSPVAFHCRLLPSGLKCASSKSRPMIYGSYGLAHGVLRYLDPMALVIQSHMFGQIGAVG